MRDVDAANRVLDQMTDDFRLDTLEPSEEERTDRQEEYFQVFDYLDHLKLPEMDIVKISAKLMDAWNERNDSYYYELGTHVTNLFYQNFEITKEEGQWMFIWQEDESQNFAHADLLCGLRVIDGLVEQGVLKIDLKDIDVIIEKGGLK